MKKLITIFGGSGFIGRHLVRRLARRGHRIRVAVRYPDRALYLKPAGDVGQIQVTQANLRYPESVARALEGADAAVNLVGVLVESGKQRFQALQHEGAATVAKAAADAGVHNLVQISAIGADPNSKSRYARSKGQGEAAVLDAFTGAAILRPSVVFGPDDQFFNKFAGLARLPLVPIPLAGAKTKLQPVYVGDVAEAVARLAVGGTDCQSGVFEIGGPEVFTLCEIVEFVLKETGRRKLIVPLPSAPAKIQAAFLQFAFAFTPFEPPLTIDQVRLLAVDNVVSGDFPGLSELGIAAESVAAIVPPYLERFREKGQFAGGHGTA